MPVSVVSASYWIETYGDVEAAAQAAVNEQSTGTFTRVPLDTDELRARHRAVVREIVPAEPSDLDPLPGALRPPGTPRRAAIVTIDYPMANVGTSLPNLLATVAGNAFELPDFAAIRLLDVELPEEWKAAYPGPQFGIAGTRLLAERASGPLIGAVMKPNIGLRPPELQDPVYDLAVSGIDFIKDDELLGNPPYCPLEERVPAVIAAIERAADETGKRTLYMFNITDDIGALRGHHDVVADAGACAMVLAGLAYIRKHASVPIHGHRAMFAGSSRHPSLGVGFIAFQKLARLAGADHLHVGGFSSKFFESNESVAASVRAVQASLLGGYSCFPVLSSKQWAGTAAITYATVGNCDLMIAAGGGIIGHPDGSAAGVQSMRDAWDAAAAGVPASDHAEASPALRAALDHFQAEPR
jgi:3-oxoisoapionate-4-phosphate transcarboxylase/hydrolase